MTKTLAYCYASGEIHLGSKVPDGALPLFIEGSKSALDEFLIVKAEITGLTPLTLAVPGVTGKDVDADYLALRRFIFMIDDSARAAGIRSDEIMERQQRILARSFYKKPKMRMRP